MSDDFIHAANEHEQWIVKERNTANERRRDQRNTLAGYILSAFASVVIAVTLIVSLWHYYENKDQRTQELEQMCMDRGGNWLSLGTNADPVCVKISEVAQ